MRRFLQIDSTVQLQQLGRRSKRAIAGSIRNAGARLISAALKSSSVDRTLRNNGVIHALCRSLLVSTPAPLKCPYPCLPSHGVGRTWWLHTRKFHRRSARSQSFESGSIACPARNSQTSRRKARVEGGVGDKGVCEFAVCKSKTPRVILWTNPALQALLLYSTQIYAPSQSAVSSLAVGDQREELLQNLDGGLIRGPYTDACINTCIR